MNTTRLMLNNNDELLIPNYEKSINSPITAINEDELSSSTSELEVESVSDNGISYDTIDNTSNEIVYETFFTQISHRFSVFNSLTFEELPSKLFLDTCENYILLVNRLNSPLVGPLKADINGNINKLRQKMNQDETKFQTLYAIINDEIEARTTNARNSATDALLWLKRAFDFLSCLLHEFGIGDKSLVDAVSKAYEQSLRRYHGLFARSIFSVARRAVPNNAEFLRSFAVNPDDALQTNFEHQLFKEMLDHASSMSSALEKITLFYSKHGLESVTVTN